MLFDSILTKMLIFYTTFVGILRATLKDIYKINIDVNEDTLELPHAQLEKNQNSKTRGRSSSVSTLSVENSVFVCEGDSCLLPVDVLNDEGSTIACMDSQLNDNIGIGHNRGYFSRFIQSFCSRGELLQECDWEQRLLFWVIESISSETITIIVRFQTLVSSVCLRFGPTKNHLNPTFDGLDEMQFNTGIRMGTYALMFDLIFFIFYGWIVPRKILVEQFDVILSMKTLTAYIYGENVLFIGLWLTATGMFVFASMIKHFGVDFSLDFEWLQCTNVSTRTLMYLSVSSLISSMLFSK